MADKQIVTHKSVVYDDKEDGNTIIVHRGVAYVHQDAPPVGGATIPVFMHNYRRRRVK